LAHGEDLLDFGDIELFLFEQEENAQAAGVGEDLQRFEDIGQNISMLA
jgi:hypothetical protein